MGLPTEVVRTAARTTGVSYDPWDSSESWDQALVGGVVTAATPATAKVTATAVTV